MKIYTIIFIFFFSFWAFSCGKNRESYNNKVIPAKTFTQILMKIHIADAIFTKENLLDTKLKDDSLSYYNQIFKEFNISREQFYFSLKYYVKHIDKFIVIENNVKDSLRKKYNLLDSLQRNIMEKHDLWTLKKDWQIPRDGDTNSIFFSFRAKDNGTYTLMAKIYIFPDDLSKNLNMQLTAFYSDSTIQKRAKRIISRKQWKEYSVVLPLNPSKSLNKIECKILSHSKSTTYMHINVKDIILVNKKELN